MTISQYILCLYSRFTSAVYGLCLYYGANAVRVFVGNRMYELIVGNDPNEWTWPVYWNLPLIPFYLIVSHIGPRLENLLLTPIRLPILFSLLFPPPSALAVTHQAIDLPTFLLSFPPTPALCALLYPWIRTWYTSLRTRLTRYVLGLGPDAVPRNQRQGIVVDNNANNNAVEAEGGILGADFRIILDLQDGNAQGEMGGPAAPAAGDNAAGNNQNVANALPQNDRRHLRLTFSSFGRFLASALLQPWVAALSGKALELLSKRWRFLRVLLAMDIPQTPRPGWLSNIIQDSPQWRNLSSGMVWYPPWPLQPMDSIWYKIPSSYRSLSNITLIIGGATPLDFRYGSSHAMPYPYYTYSSASASSNLVVFSAVPSLASTSEHWTSSLR